MICVIAPQNGSTVSLLSKEQKDFNDNIGLRKSAKAEDYDYLNLVAVAEDRTSPNGVVFKWTSDAGSAEFTLEVSAYADFKETIQIKTAETQVRMYNLLLGRLYYFRVSSAEDTSQVCQFYTESVAPRCIHIPGLVNVRDAGGWQTEQGHRIRQGILYRGCKLEPTKSGKPPIITDLGKQIMARQLNIRTDLDLRAQSIGTLEESQLSEYGVRYVILPCKSCEDFLEEECAEGNCKLFSFLSEAENYPIYMHCWGGADRTGTVMLFLGAILGMKQEDMFLDYEFSTLAIWGVRTRNSESMQKLLSRLAAFGAEDNWTENAIRYLRSIGVSEETMDRIRRIFLQ